MIALSCKEIFMGKHSNLGPIDPQILGLPAHGVIDEFNRAQSDIAGAKNPEEQASKIATWQPIIAKYTPTLIGECVNAITWSSNLVTEWLKSGMFEGEQSANESAAKIVQELSSHEETKTHARHIHVERLQELGVKVVPLESNQELQDAVLAVHHSSMNTLQRTAAVKIIENQNAISFIIQAVFQPQIALPIQPQGMGAEAEPAAPSGPGAQIIL
jgi:hypothetical protein